MAESAEALDRIAAALDELPPKLRSVVVLKDVYGLSHEAIADELGISVVGGQGPAAPGPAQLRDVLYEEGAEVSCGVTRSPRCCPGIVDGTIQVDRATQRVHSRRACAARPSSPGTGSCSAPSSSCAPATSSRRPACSATTLAALTDDGRAAACVALDPHRPRLAYAGAAIGGVAAAGAAAAAV